MQLHLFSNNHTRKQSEIPGCTSQQKSQKQKNKTNKKNPEKNPEEINLIQQ